MKIVCNCGKIIGSFNGGKNLIITVSESSKIIGRCTECESEFVIQYQSQISLSNGIKDGIKELEKKEPVDVDVEWNYDKVSNQWIRNQLARQRQ